MLLGVCKLRRSCVVVRVSICSDQFLVGAGIDPHALLLEHGGEGALRGMLRFFLWYALSALDFLTALDGLVGEVALAVPNIMYVLMVPSVV